VTEDHLWLFEKDGVQVLDIHTNRIVQHIDLPKLAGSNVLDVAEMGNYAYLTMAEGIYKIPLNIVASKTQPKGFLDYIVVDNKDTIFSNNASLPYDKNDVHFYFSSPTFYDAEGCFFPVPAKRSGGRLENNQPRRTDDSLRFPSGRRLRL
jgi:hypothetical protein